MLRCAGRLVGGRRAARRGHGRVGGQSIVRSSDVIAHEICFANGPMHGHDGGASS